MKKKSLKEEQSSVLESMCPEPNDPRDPDPEATYAIVDPPKRIVVPKRRIPTQHYTAVGFQERAKGRVPIIDILHPQTTLSGPPKLMLTLYGQPGSGKSYLANKANETEGMKPALRIDAEDKPRSSWIKGNKIGRVVPENWQHVMQIYGQLLKPHPFKTIIYDNLTVLNGMLLEMLLKERPPEEKFAEDVPQYAHHYRRALHWDAFFKAHKAMNINVILVAWETLPKDKPKKGYKGILPCVAGRTSQEVVGRSDVAAHLYVKNKQFRISFASREGFIAADDTWSLPEDCVNNEYTTMQMIWDASQGRGPIRKTKRR